MSLSGILSFYGILDHSHISTGAQIVKGFLEINKLSYISKIPRKIDSKFQVTFPGGAFDVIQKNTAGGTKERLPGFSVLDPTTTCDLSVAYGVVPSELAPPLPPATRGGT